MNNVNEQNGAEKRWQEIVARYAHPDMARSI